MQLTIQQVISQKTNRYVLDRIIQPVAIAGAKYTFIGVPIIATMDLIC